MPAYNPDYVLGKGIIYFDRVIAGVYEGERDLGNTPGFSVAASTEKSEHYSSRGGLRQKDRDITTSIDRTATLSCDDMRLENLALFIAGDISTVTQAGTPVTDEAITVNKGRFYQLGVTTGNPTGVRNVSSVVVTNAAGSTTYVLNTDYELDAALARIYIIPGGAIANAASILVDYTPAANTRQRIATSSTPVRGRLRYIADNPEGANKDLFAPDVSLSPSGEAQLISDDWASMSFDVGFNQVNGVSVYIDGRPA